MVRRRKNFEPLTMEFFFDCSIPEPNSGCWIWMKAIHPNGYGVLRLGNKTKTAHRASFETYFNITAPKNLDVCHKCDNRACVNPDHLFLGTRKDNMIDCSRKGRIRMIEPGENCPSAKLSESDVLAIRADSRSLRKIGRHYNVDKSNILSIKQRKTWKHI